MRKKCTTCPCKTQNELLVSCGITLPKSVIAEVYLSIFRNRFPRDDRTADQQDAYSVTRWLTEADEHGFLKQYFQPPLTEDQRRIAAMEGWILGIC